MIQYEIKITGRVQGVGFRYFVYHKAVEHEIYGWVKNTRDGGVLVMAQGKESDVQTFLDHLRIGPPLARVDKIVRIKKDLLTEFTNFYVKT